MDDDVSHVGDVPRRDTVFSTHKVAHVVGTLPGRKGARPAASAGAGFASGPSRNANQNAPPVPPASLRQHVFLVLTLKQDVDQSS